MAWHLFSSSRTPSGIAFIALALSSIERPETSVISTFPSETSAFSICSRTLFASALM